MSEQDASAPLRSQDDLLAPFFAAMKPPAEFRIGAEAEKFGVDAVTAAPIPYEGERGVVAVLAALVERHGWKPDAETPGGPLISLLRAGASVTLEPGGQLELSGAAFDNVHQICAESSGHMAELRDISSELGVTWLGVGFHPFARQEDLTWVPKGRYAIMRRYLPTRGTGGLDMMRRTATVQANFDYESEASAMRALRVSLRLSPLVTAMFANSPFYEGKRFGGKSYRARVWLDVDPARQGLVAGALRSGSRLSDYVEWALDAPMFLFKRGGELRLNTGQTFRSFLRHGFEGERATLADWELHLNTLFPEVRLKKTLEVRGADSQNQALLCALPALWTGILYDGKALDEAEAMSEAWTHEELETLRPQVADLALGATFRGERLAALAERLVDVARGGLERRARIGRAGRDEGVHLDKLGALVGRGLCPADALLEGLPDGAGTDAAFRAEILARARM